jgi:pyruvate dehydrogenase (quinone)
VDHPGELKDIWKEAWQSDRPCLVEAVTDPEVPPLPPHITFEQAVHFWEAIYKGDQSRWSMVKQSVKDMIESYIPHGKSD